MLSKNLLGSGVLFILAILLTGNAQAQAKVYNLSGMGWKSVGPALGGRSLSATGSIKRPNEYYFGATGGGLWKTTDGGARWDPVTDGMIQSSSVGAVAVSESNPDVVYIGMGESELRGSVIQGDGVYKSIDGGKTWSHMGLEDTQTISRIRIDPANPDLVYVAALGHPFGKSEDRGVFRSKDGGKTWQKILYYNDHAGAIDLALDPHDPTVLFASIWDVYRRPWMLSSGGPSSGLFKSTDGGDTWTNITRNPGLPETLLGKINVVVSGADSNRIYAMIEAENGGLFRSDDRGGSWIRVNDDHNIRQRAFYFNRMTTDPKDRNILYLLNVEMYKSIDGGKTLIQINTQHPDHHDLWVAADNPNRMIVADDGGASISVDGGGTWTTEHYPTAQYYHVETTKDVPYLICGTQQDLATACVRSDSSPGQEVPQNIDVISRSEDGYVASDPRNANVFFIGGQAGTIERYDRSVNEDRDVQVNPLFFSGMPAKDLKERWQWVFPIVYSPLDPHTLYTSSQHLWKSDNEGQTWTRISPDLTRADVNTLGDSGGPINHDENGPEIYGTIFTIAPSHFNTKVIWTGSDDGIAHVTQDGGVHWTDVTPPTLPHFSRISMIEASTHNPARAYLVANQYELDNRKPYVFRTDDLGRTWTPIVTGIRADDFARAIREDPIKAGLLYLGTEHGVYVSFDNGGRWQSLSLNLPDVQVPDLLIDGDDLVIATHGRSFYLLRDISALRQITPEVTTANVHLFKPAAAIRSLRPAYIDYFLATAGSAVTITIRNAKDTVVQTFRTPGGKVLAKATNTSPTNNKGMNRFEWNLHYPGPVTFSNMYLGSSESPRYGPAALPGEYKVELSLDGRTQSQILSIALDARLKTVTHADLVKQFLLATKTRDQFSSADCLVIQIRALKSQIDDRIDKAKNAKVAAAGFLLGKELSAVEGSLYQVRNESPRDYLNYPIKLNDQLSYLLTAIETGDVRPTNVMYSVSAELTKKLDNLTLQMQDTLHGSLAQFNALLQSRNLKPVASQGEQLSKSCGQPRSEHDQ